MARRCMDLFFVLALILFCDDIVGLNIREFELNLLFFWLRSLSESLWNRKKRSYRLISSLYIVLFRVQVGSMRQENLPSYVTSSMVRICANGKPSAQTLPRWLAWKWDGIGWKVIPPPQTKTSFCLPIIQKMDHLGKINCACLV